MIIVDTKITKIIITVLLRNKLQVRNTRNATTRYKYVKYEEAEPIMKGKRQSMYCTKSIEQVVSHPNQL